MNEQQTKETKQPSGLKPYAIIVAAIVTGAAAIGIGAEVISEIDAQPVRRQKMAQLNSEILQGREYMMITAALMLRSDSPGYKLYQEWLDSATQGTPKEQEARLAELERKLKVMEPGDGEVFPEGKARPEMSSQ
jgi:hypothetical protein